MYFKELFEILYLKYYIWRGEQIINIKFTQKLRLYQNLHFLFNLSINAIYLNFG